MQEVVEADTDGLLDGMDDAFRSVRFLPFQGLVSAAAYRLLCVFRLLSLSSYSN